MLASPESFKEHIDADQLISAVGGTSDYVFDINAMTESMPEVAVDPWAEEVASDDVVTGAVTEEGITRIECQANIAGGESKDS